MAGNRIWEKAEDDIIVKFPEKTPEALQKMLEFMGFRRSWGAVFSRHQILTGKRKREGYPDGYIPQYGDGTPRRMVVPDKPPPNKREIISQAVAHWESQCGLGYKWTTLDVIDFVECNLKRFIAGAHEPEREER